MAHTPQSWLWPDHVIGNRESRVLREEHNALVNINADREGLAMRYCPCPSPTAGAGTLTDYTVRELYRLCRDCGLPIRLSALPAPTGEVDLRWLQVKREGMKRTCEEV